jgi:hypothetical protein
MIDRFPLTGAVRDLVPVDTGSDAETGFAGRFVNPLEGRGALKGWLNSCYGLASPEWKVPARSRESRAVCISGQMKNAKHGGQSQFVWASTVRGKNSHYWSWSNQRT